MVNVSSVQRVTADSLMRREFADEDKIWQLIQSPSTHPDDLAEKTKLEKYILNCRVSKGEFEIKYKLSKDRTDDGYGRYYATGLVGLQSFSKNVRAFIADPKYKDIDCVNCIFTILLHLCNKHGIEAKEIEEYVDNRAKILEQNKLDKQAVLEQMLNNYREPKNRFVKAMHRTVHKNLVPLLKELPEWKELYETSKEKNRSGSFTANATYTIENQILWIIVGFLEERKWSADVLIFDGTMAIQTDGQDGDIAQLLRECEKIILDETGVPMKLADKEMTVSDEFLIRNNLCDSDIRDLIFPSDFKAQLVQLRSVSPEVEDDETISAKKAQAIFANGKGADKLVQYLNNYFAKVTDGAVWYCYRHTKKDPWLWRGKADTMNALEHLTFTYWVSPTMSSEVNVFRWWCSKPTMRTYKRLVIDPSYIGEKPGEELNLFRGFKAKLLDNYDPDIVQPILDHLRNVLCNNDEANYQYKTKWLALIVQRPQVKNGTALVDHGKQGAGKNILYEFFGEKVIGKDHYLYVADYDQLTGQFNAQFLGKVFVLGDEITYSGGHKANNKLKSIITQDWQRVEKKGKDAEMMNDYTNYVFLSNNPKPVKVEDSNRRYYVTRVSNCRRGDGRYFTALAAHLEKTETADHFYTFLMQMDLSDFDVRNVPKNQDTADMKVHCMSSIELFTRQLLAGEVAIENDPWEVKTDEQQEEEKEGEEQELECFKPGQKYFTSIDVLYRCYLTVWNENNFPDEREATKKGTFSTAIRKKVKIENKTKNRAKGTPVILTVAKQDD